MNPRQTLFLLLAFAQFGTSRLHELTGLGRSVGAMANDAPTPATPAGYAFLIWILIFTLWAVIAVRQARLSQASNLLWQRLGWPMVLTMAAGNLWMLTATLHGNGLVLLALIVVMAGGAFTALGRAVATIGNSVPATPFNRYIVLPALGIMAGWLSLASFLNLAGAVQLSLHIVTGNSAGAIATLIAATLAGCCILRALRRQPCAATVYALTLIWGLLAVALANASLTFSAIGYLKLPVGITALLCATVIFILLGWQQTGQK